MNNIYKQLSKAIILAASVIILIWLFYKIISVILLLLLAIVLALAINTPVTILERKKIKRMWAAAIVFIIIFIAFGGIILLVGPKVSDQISLLIKNLPAYTIQLSEKVSSWFEGYPELQEKIRVDPKTVSDLFPSMSNAIQQVGDFSLSVITQIIVVIVFISMVAYMVTNPRPLFELYLVLFPPAQRDKATVAFTKMAVMIKAWMKANLIGGFINSSAVIIFLNLMHVPGAFVWGALAFFSEFIPRIGFFIKALPPILVALSVNGYTATWVTVFYLAMDELMADFVMPKVRATTMKIHPVSILFVVMAMGAAFGFVGVLLATPLTAIIKAYFEVFYVDQQAPDKLIDKRIDEMIYNHTAPKKT